jgi:hypothetical protein
MTDYTKATNFATKDALVTGDPLKVVKGTEIDDEFNAIEDAVETKADLASPTFTGVPKAPTAAAGTNTTQLATTAFVDTALDNYTVAADSVTSAMLQENSVTTRELNVADAGTAGQFLISDADGSFSWYTMPGAASNPFLSPAASDPTQRDDSSALQEGDIYYNTADDELKTYDGSSWNSSTEGYDPAAGATGTTSIPPVGAIVCGTLTYRQSIPHFGSGYGDTATLGATYNPDLNVGYGFVDSSPDYGSSFTINSGTWRYLGGSLNNTCLLQRIA